MFAKTQKFVIKGDTMSVAGISTSLYASNNSQSIPPHNNVRLRENIGKLGQDLQSGNFSAAQQDFATLQSGPLSSSIVSAHGNNPIAQAVNQLAEELQTGSPTAAQPNVQPNSQAPGQTTQTRGHHHHAHGGGEASQLLDQLGQDLQTGSLNTAQQTYSSVLQDLSFGQSPAQPQSPDSNSVSFSA
jgi:hypothetical protein